MSRGRSAVALAARSVLLAGATVLAFFTGGYFPEAQAWAGLVVWALVAVALLVVRSPMPRRAAAWLALGGLALLGGWTLLSILWAPIAGSAYHAGQLVFLYLGGLVAATLLFRGSRSRSAVEPALAAGAVIVIGYAISERLLPGVLHFARSVSAQGRLEQPLTYWNAEGELAALGFVLSAGVAGQRSRPLALRSLAAAAAAPLGMGLYLSFSRGALFGCAAGLVALIVAAPRREQLSAIVRALVFGLLASAVAAPFGAVTGLHGSLATRERDGAIVLVVLVGLMVAGGLTELLTDRRARSGRLRLPRRTPAVATGVIAAGLAVAILLGAHESNGIQPLPGGATRLVSLQSNRYAYWSVALRAFASEPLHGVGAGGWTVDWLRWRKIADSAQDAHSLELQTLAELGVIGALLLAAVFVGIGLEARRALRHGAPVAPAVAALVVYLAHSPLDWDWQMPAVTLVAVVLAGVVLGADDELSDARYSSSAIRGASRRKSHTARTEIAT